MSAFDKYQVFQGLPVVGQKVKYTKPTKHSWFTNVIDAEKLLVLGNEYTVAKVELNSSSTYVWLQEFPKGDRDLPFFSMGAFQWEMPKLIDPKLIIGFIAHEALDLNRVYGFGIKLNGVLKRKGTPVLCCEYINELEDFRKHEITNAYYEESAEVVDG